MEFKGRIYKVFPIVEGTSASGNNWRRQSFIFEYFEHETDRWSDRVLLSAMNGKIDEYDLHECDNVIIGFGHSVKEYNGKHFNELRIYKFVKQGSAIPEGNLEEITDEDYIAPQEPEPKQDVAEEDDLPF